MASTRPADTASCSPGDRSAKRQKVTRACDNCKARKRRCTGELPCKICVASGATCTYLASYTRGKLVQPQAASAAASHAPQSSTGPSPHQRAIPLPSRVAHGTRDTETARAASPDAGECQITDSQYSGPTSSYSFLRRAWKRVEQDNSNVTICSHKVPEVLKAPSSGDVSVFQFGDRLAPDVDIEGFRLPERAYGFNLVDQYFDLAMPTNRFFHQQTVTQWLEAYYQQEEVATDREILSPTRQAAVLIILATSRVFSVMSQERPTLGHAGDLWHSSERICQVALKKLEAERGRPRLESVQARLASVLYLLQVSRPNQAYYQFGTTIQMATALGLHRASIGFLGQQDPISAECRKRTFWCCCTLDTYLCLILGRPPLIHLDDVDQLLPNAIDDQDLADTETSVDDQTPRDCVVKASILHAQIARIAKRAIHQQCSVQRKSASEKLEDIMKLNEEIKAWHESIPIVLSGAIHPSSLIPIFRRQVAVLELAHSHARMLVNRPTCLPESTAGLVQESRVDECLSAAKSALDIVSASNLSRHTILWYTQFVTFNALSIVWVYLIERKPGNRLYLTPSLYDPDELLRQAEAVQKDFIEATRDNAPSLRYYIVLEEFLQEVKRGNPDNTGFEPSGSTNHTHATIESSSNNYQDPADCTSDVMDVFANFPTDETLWFALDSLPFSDYTG